MGKYLDYYCGNQYAKLKMLVNKLIQTEKFGWLPQSEYDDIYSIAAQAVWNCERKFDEDRGATFETYLTNCLQRKIRTRITYLNRDKRKCNTQAISLDGLKEEYGDHFAIDEQVRNSGEYSEKVLDYLAHLTEIQRSVLFMLADGYLPLEIQETLGISKAKYNQAIEATNSYKNIQLLF